MPKKLKVTLPEGWSDESVSRENGVLTYVRERSRAAGVLQISLSIDQRQRRTQTPQEDLVEMAIMHVVTQNLGRLDQCSNGSCSSGDFASVVFWSEKAPRSQIWFISNGLEMITVTHICRAVPDSAEIQEASMIAETVEILEG